MKKSIHMILALTVAFAASSAFAGANLNSSWSALNSDSNISVAWPQVSFGNNVVLPLNEVCLKDGQFRTLNAVPTCVKSSLHRYEVINATYEGAETWKELAPGEKAYGRVVERQECDQYGSTFLTAPTQVSYQACDAMKANVNGSWDGGAEAPATCASYKTISYDIPTSTDVQVFQVSNGYEGPSYDLLGSKHFDVPACK